MAGTEAASESGEPDVQQVLHEWALAMARLRTILAQARALEPPRREAGHRRMATTVRGEAD